MQTSKNISRSELADALAIERVEYERYVAEAGYPESAQLPLLPFVKQQTFHMAKHGQNIAGVSVMSSPYGSTFTTRVDWAKLAALVEKKLPTWREAVARSES